MRLLYHTGTGDLWYTTFGGDVYQIKNNKGTISTSQKIFTAEGHAITRLQGADFLITAPKDSNAKITEFVKSE